MPRERRNIVSKHILRVERVVCFLGGCFFVSIKNYFVRKCSCFLNHDPDVVSKENVVSTINDISELLTDEGNDLPKFIQVSFGFQNPQKQHKNPQEPRTKKPQIKAYPKHFFLISTTERIYFLDS